MSETVSFSAQECAQKVRFYKPCTTAASERFDHANRTLHLKVGVLVYTGSRLSKISRQTINRFIILWALHGSVRCCETRCKTDCATLLALETQDVERGQLQMHLTAWNPCVFNCVYLFAWSRLKFFVLSDLKHGNRPIKRVMTSAKVTSLVCRFWSLPWAQYPVHTEA